MSPDGTAKAGTPYPIEALEVLAWTVRVGATIAPAGDGVELLAPVVGAPVDPCEVAAVVLALGATWRDVRRAFDLAHAALGALGCPGWPALSSDVVTVAAWAWTLVAVLDADAEDVFEERAAVYEHDAGCPRWLAELRGAEDMVRRLALGATPALAGVLNSAHRS